MVEVSITRKLKAEKLESLFKFLFSLSDQVCFSTFHNYRVNEDNIVEVINEYKERCKSKHHQLTVWYNKQDPVIMKTLKRLGVKDEDTFNEYKMRLFQSDMMLCKNMEEYLEKLLVDETDIDYNEIFPTIKDGFSSLEIHMFDSISVSRVPMDLLTYNLTESVKTTILNMKSLLEPTLFNKEKNIFLFNTLFCKNEEGFAVINSQQGSMEIMLEPEQYLLFKKLKIKHKKAEIENDEEQ